MRRRKAEGFLGSEKCDARRAASAAPLLREGRLGDEKACETYPIPRGFAIVLFVHACSWLPGVKESGESSRRASACTDAASRGRGSTTTQGPGAGDVPSRTGHSDRGPRCLIELHRLGLDRGPFSASRRWGWNRCGGLHLGPRCSYRLHCRPRFDNVQDSVCQHGQRHGDKRDGAIYRLSVRGTHDHSVGDSNNRHVGRGFLWERHGKRSAYLRALGPQRRSVVQLDVTSGGRLAAYMQFQPVEPTVQLAHP